MILMKLAVIFFGDGAPLLERYKEFGLTKTQYLLLKNFRDKFRAFSDENNWPPEFIETTEWAEVMKLAKDVLSVFNFPVC